MSVALQVLVSGLFQGSLYAMMAVGLALVWTTIGVFNFCHGVFMTLGAYVAWQLTGADGLGLPLALSCPLAIVAVALVGLVLQAGVVRPLVGRADAVLVAVITTLAASSVLENATQLVWGPRPKAIPPLAEGTVTLLGVGIAAHQVVIVLTTPVLLALLWLFLNRTRPGLALRAVAQNEDSCHLIGIPVTALYALAFGLAAAFAALAGIFFGGFKFMSPSMGTEPLTKALVVVIFGGVANITGPILAAYVIGLFEAVSTYAIGFYWTPALLFALLIAVLMLRPEGLFSGRRRGLA